MILYATWGTALPWDLPSSQWCITLYLVQGTVVMSLIIILQEAEKILERIDQLHLEFAKRASVNILLLHNLFVYHIKFQVLFYLHDLLLLFVVCFNM